MTKSAFEVKGRTGSAIALNLQGLVAGTLVMTAEGALPVEYLCAGDRIVARSGMRILRGVVVQSARRVAMVRIGKDTLGVGRPEADILVPAGQMLLVRDWRAQAMFEQPQVMVAAGRLVDGQLIRAEAGTDVRLLHLLFDRPEVLYAGGLELGCDRQTETA